MTTLNPFRMNTYYDGDVVVVDATFEDVNGNPIDPTTVKFEYTVTPTFEGSGGTTTTLTYSGATQGTPGVVAKLGTGQYEAQVDTTGLPGWWLYEWVSTGTGQGTVPGGFRVFPRPI